MPQPPPRRPYQRSDNQLEPARTARMTPCVAIYRGVGHHDAAHGQPVPRQPTTFCQVVIRAMSSVEEMTRNIPSAPLGTARALAAQPVQRAAPGNVATPHVHPGRCAAGRLWTAFP